ncbi:hypothetical protein CPC197_0438 [Chlamydia psittaci C1/97]|nr:hypothetical protein CPC197_0438 [Chlamydia psittaci C1/97]
MLDHTLNSRYIYSFFSYHTKEQNAIFYSKPTFHSLHKQPLSLANKKTLKIL